MTIRTDIRAKALPEQMRQLFSASKVSLISSMLLATLLAYLQREVIVPAVLIAWLSVIVVASLLRAALVVVSRRASAEEGVAQTVWLNWFRSLVMFSALTWGAAGFLLFPADNPLHQMILVIFLVGLTSGAVVSFSADRFCATAFPLSVLLPLMVRLFVAGDGFSVGIGAAVVLYIGFMVMNARRINQNVIDNIMLQLDAIKYAETVKASEERYRRLHNSSQLSQAYGRIGIWEYDFASDKEMWSAESSRVLGFPVMQELKLLDVAHPEDRQRIMDATQAHIEQGTVYDVAYRIIANDGKIRWMRSTGQVERDGAGNPAFMRGVVQDVTERKRLEDEREDALLRLQKIASRVPGVVYQFRLYPDGRTSFPFASDAIREIYRVSPEEVREDASKVFSILHPEDRGDVVASIRRSALELSPWRHEFRVQFDDGTVRWLLGNALPEQEAEGAVLWHGFVTDITARKLTENELKIAATVFQSQEGMFVTDVTGAILRVNRAFTEITGYAAEEATGRNPRLLSSGRHDSAFYAAMWGSLHNTGVWEGEIWNRRKGGEVYPQHLTITAVSNTDGTVTNYVATMTDITLNKAAAQEIEQLAFYDYLTGLPNRRLLLDRANQALASSSRSGKRGALLFIDLDNFKALNDTLGHDVGDLLLQQVAERLTLCVREDDTVARLGGDEFVVMLEELSEETIEAAGQTESIAHKILEALNEPYRLEPHLHHSTPSVGITLFNAHQATVEELLQQADIAMYQAKKGGRNTLRFFDQKMQEAITHRASLESELRAAIDRQQFQLYYQTQLDRAGRPYGAEALIRWIHPDRGLISPAQFIPLAEETGLILPIGGWVLEAACAQIKAWQQNAATRRLMISVNVSAKQFHQADFVLQVQAACDRHAIAPDLLKLELTESMLLEDVEDTITTMNALKSLGVQFSLDDFGTGYSSLQYLKKLPLDQLKIDQSFVRDIVNDPHDRSIVRTIIAMAQSLELEVIAEGVETEEQKQLLLRKGCIHFQGYLFGRPVPLGEFETRLK